jgi:hypothetical protein
MAEERQALVVLPGIPRARRGCRERARIVLLAAEGTAPLLARALGGIRERYTLILSG